MEQAVRRLTRSRRDRVFAGVCGGLAAYLGLDPVLVRVLYVALTLLSWGAGILLYWLAWIIIPLDAEDTPLHTASKDEPTRRDARRIAGVLLVIVGLLALLSTTFGWFNIFSSLRLAGPIVLVAVGLALLFWRREPVNWADSNQKGIAGEEERRTPDSGQSHAGSEPRRLARLESGRKIAGICAGLGEYFNIDPTIVRLIFIATIFAGGVGIILYLIMWIAVPIKHDIPVSHLGT